MTFIDVTFKQREGESKLSQLGRKEASKNDDLIDLSESKEEVSHQAHFEWMGVEEEID